MAFERFRVSPPLFRPSVNLIERFRGGCFRGDSCRDRVDVLLGCDQKSRARHRIHHFLASRDVDAFVVNFFASFAGRVNPTNESENGETKDETRKRETGRAIDEVVHKYRKPRKAVELAHDPWHSDKQAEYEREHDEGRMSPSHGSYFSVRACHACKKLVDARCYGAHDIDDEVANPDKIYAECDDADNRPDADTNKRT